MTKTANYGLGKIGTLEDAMSLTDFVKFVKHELDIPSVRYTGDANKHIQKVAIIGGAGVVMRHLHLTKVQTSL